MEIKAEEDNEKQKKAELLNERANRVRANMSASSKKRSTSPDLDSEGSAQKKKPKGFAHSADNDIIIIDSLKEALDEATDRSIDQKIAETMKSIDSTMKDVANSMKDIAMSMKGLDQSMKNMVENEKSLLNEIRGLAASVGQIANNRQSYLAPRPDYFHSPPQ